MRKSKQRCEWWVVEGVMVMGESKWRVSGG